MGWTRPDLAVSTSQLDPDHPLFPVVEAMAKDDCSTVVNESTRLRDLIATEVQIARAAVGGSTEEALDGETSPEQRSASMRRILETYVYRRPQILEVGEVGFVYPTWWTDELGYCLAELGRYAESADIYAARLQQGIDLDAMWRLALVLAWDGRNRDAVEVLEAWPSESPRPREYESVLERLRRDEQLPNNTDLEQLSLR